MSDGRVLGSFEPQRTDAPLWPYPVKMIDRMLNGELPYTGFER